MIKKKLYHTNKGWMIGSALISAAVLPITINSTKANADTINSSSNLNSEEINKNNVSTSSSIINSSTNDSSSQNKDIKSSNVNDNNGLNVSSNDKKQDNKQNQNSNLDVTNNQINNASSNNNFGGDVTSNNSAIKDNAVNSKNINSNNQEAEINAKDNQVSYASNSNDLNSNNTNVNYKDKAASFATTNNASNAPITDTIPTNGPTLDDSHVNNYHLNVSQGWSNDVQSITQDKDGTYNIYYLHSVDGATNPFGDNGQDWFHTATKDWKTFSTQSVAINSHGTDNQDSWKSAWTGSVITNQGNITGVPEGDKVAYFSGLDKKDGSQNIYAAWSDDNGNTFTHALNDGKPVLAWNQNGASGKQDQERDADVVYWNGKMLMYTAEGNQLGVYQSKDGINWTKADPNGESKVKAYTFMNGMNWQDNDMPVECPQLRFMKTPDGQTKAVLFFGDKSMNTDPKQTTGTYYVVGHLDDNGLFTAETNAKRLDLGSDYYGSNVSGSDDLSKPDDSLIGLGWIGNWNYTAGGVYDNQNDHKYPDDKDQLTQRLGAYSIPRKMVLNNNLTISSTPLNELKNISDTTTATADNPSTTDGKKTQTGTDTYGPIYVFVDHPGDSEAGVYDLHLKTKDNSNFNGRIHIDIWQGKDYVKFNYDPTNGNMAVAEYAEELNNDMTGTSASSAYYDGMQGNGNGYIVNTGLSNTNDIDLKVFTDKDSIELFFPNGQVYTVARYATQNTQDFKVYCEDPNNKDILELTKQEIQPISLSADDNSSNTGDNDTADDELKDKYNYRVTYFDNSGNVVGNYNFYSSTSLNGNEITEKVKSGTKLNVIDYDTDQDVTDDGQVIDTITAYTGESNVPIKSYQYNITYQEDDNKPLSSISFNSNYKLSYDELMQKIKDNIKDKSVNSYEIESEYTDDNGVEEIEVYANVIDNNSSDSTSTNKPSGNTGSSNTNDSTSTNKPSGNTGSSNTNGNTSTNKPSGDTGSSNTSDNTSTNKPSGDTGSSNTNGNTSTNKPSGDTGSSNTSDNTSTNKPSGDTGSSNTSDNTSTNKPSGDTGSSNTNGNTSTNKPSDDTGSSNTGGSTSTNKPSGDTGSSNTSGSTSTNKPNDDTGSSNTSGSTSTNKPNDDTGSSNTSGSTSTNKPSGDTGSSNTSGSTSTNKPSGDTGSSNTNDSTSTNKPSDDTGSSNTNSNTSTNKPSSDTGSLNTSDNTSTNKPSSDTGSSNTNDSTSTNKPSSDTGSSNTSDNTSTNKPNGNTGSSNTSDNTSTNKPSDDTGSSNTSDNTSANKPNDDTDSSNTSGSTSTNKPSDDTDLSNANNSASTNKPNDDTNSSNTSGNVSINKSNDDTDLSNTNELINNSVYSGSPDINPGEINNIFNKDINNNINSASDDKSETNGDNKLPQTGDTKDELLLSLMLASGLIGMGMIKNKKED